MKDTLLGGVMLWLLEFGWAGRLAIGALVGALLGAPAAAFIPLLWTKGSADHQSSSPATGGNKMGNVTGNQGIVSQGQTGDNKVSK